MKKWKKKTAWIPAVRTLGLLCLLSVLMCLNVSAATKTVSMKTGGGGKNASVSFKGKDYDYVFCKVKLSQGGIIKVTGNRVNTKGSILNTSYRLYGAKKVRIDPASYNRVNEYMNLCHYHVVKPGTYYFRVKGGKAGTTTLKLEYVLTAGVTGGAGRDTALAIGAGKSVTGVISSHPTVQDRYYKFYHTGGTFHILAMTNGGCGAVYFNLSGPNNTTGYMWIESYEYGQNKYTLDVSGTAGWYYLVVKKDLSRAPGKYASAEYAIKWYR